MWDLESGHGVTVHSQDKNLKQGTGNNESWMSGFLGDIEKLPPYAEPCEIRTMRTWMYEGFDQLVEAGGRLGPSWMNFSMQRGGYRCPLATLEFRGSFWPIILADVMESARANTACLCELGPG